MKFVPHRAVKPPAKVVPPPAFQKIKILPWMREIAAIRGMGANVALYLFQLAESDRASLRAKKFCDAAVERARIEKSAPEPMPAPVRLPVDRAQRILFLLAENIPVVDIAERCGVSRSTIRRIASHASQRAARWSETSGRQE
jgi:hypothetical protein